MEIWKDIQGYDGLYQVSNIGRVKSLNYSRTGKEKILKPCKANGYLQVYLYKEGKSKMYKIHRLVAMAFIPNPDNLPCVNHIDEDKSNNCEDNLEWCTVAYNNTYGTRIQRQAESLKGFKHSEETRKKLSEARKGKHHSEESKAKMSESHKGKPKSEEAIKKMSESLKGKYKGENSPLYGKPKSEEHRKKIIESHMRRKVYCVETDKVYNSIKEASEELGLFSTGICACCKGKQKHYKGYHFYYTENIIFMN